MIQLNLGSSDNKTNGSTELHNKIVSDTLIILGKKASHLCRVWPNETGAAYRIVDGKKIWIHYGLKGSSDILGVLRNGKILCIEIKTGQATQQENQKSFERMIRDFTGVYILAHSAHEALDKILQINSLQNTEKI